MLKYFHRLKLKGLHPQAEASEHWLENGTSVLFSVERVGGRYLNLKPEP